MRIDFRGQVVLVTGATRGLGKQLADDFDRLGAELILTGTDHAQIDDLNLQTARQKCRRKLYHAVDFTNPRSLDAFLTLLSGTAIDVCVNNAGINRLSPIYDSTVDDWRDVLTVNLEAPLLITRTISRGMKERGFGRIVNIGSIFGQVSRASRAFYSVTKFGLHGLTVATAVDLAPHGVLVNTVSPGFVQTDLTDRVLSSEERSELAARVPLGRFADTGDISRVVLFVASRLNTYLTGQNIVVDGGFVDV